MNSLLGTDRHSIEPRQDETYGADSGFLGTVDVRRQIFLPGELGKNRERGAGGAPINM